MSPIFSGIVCFRPGREVLLPFALIKFKVSLKAQVCFLVKCQSLRREGGRAPSFKCPRSTDSALISVLEKSIVGVGGNGFAEVTQLVSDAEVRGS